MRELAMSVMTTSDSPALTAAPGPVWPPALRVAFRSPHGFRLFFDGPIECKR